MPGSHDALVARFWRGTSLKALAPLLAAVFANFAALGFLVDVGGRGRLHPAALALIVLFSGLTAVAYALIAIRRRFLLFALVLLLQLLVPGWLTRRWPGATDAPTGEALRTRLVVDAAGAVAGIAIGYAFFMMFITREGVRRVRSETEIELAREIHASLVPDVSLHTHACEIHGRSVPASLVGGDLVDAVVVEGRPLGFLADVSGHGVPAGTLLGLVKAGFRTRARAGGDPGEILADLNEVVSDLTQPNRYATAALVALEAPDRVVCALAGHPPILHWSRERGQVVRVAGEGMALGILPSQRYEVRQLDVGQGDVLAIVSDGFTETMDRQDRELGLEPLEAALAQQAGRPLPELLDRLFAVASRHGAQQDDRSLLLLRVGPG